MPDKVVVVGGSGFLGSHLSDELTSRGFDVTIYDRSTSSYLSDTQKMVVGELDDIELLNKTISEARFVFHLAGIADIKESGQKRMEALQSNIIGSANVIEACLASPSLERLVFASSVYVYSEQGSFYRVSKQAVELLLENYRQECGLQYTIIRYGSLYGPRSQDWNGLKSLVKQAVVEGEIHFSGTGEERREYIHVNDATQLTADILSPEYANGCFTITGNQVLKTQELLQLIKEILGQPVDLHFSEDNTWHYGLTPYRYTPRKAKKMVPTTFYDIGQGVLELIEEVSRELEQES